MAAGVGRRDPFGSFEYHRKDKEFPPPGMSNAI